MTDLKIIVTTAEELSQIVAREVEKCFATKQHNAEIAKQPLEQKQGNYTSKDLQLMFNISTTTIFNWERKSLLKPIIVSRRKSYLREDIELLIRQKQLKKRA